MDLENNRLAQMFDLEAVKKAIKDCPKDEIVILMPHYNINKPEYSKEECADQYDIEDMLDLGDYLGVFLQVSDYDDLICDPHGLMDK